ncbi:MAG TPA: hypothetical protein VFQ61_33175 [Polyangiaceae bacterium]|nr:hypothetical protein [Polyangiaceae bacterium]
MNLRAALALYALFTTVAFALASPELFRQHTHANHFALLAEAWLQGRLDLPGPPPAYTGNDDFAYFEGRHFIVFPPFPALLVLPLVGLLGSAARLPDGAFFLGCAGAAPALLFMALQKLSAVGISARSQRENWVIAALFGFGSVYFFSAVQGTVWFAAHVVGTSLAAGFLYCAIGAEHPIWAGVLLGLAGATRTPLFFAAPFFFFECLRGRSWRELGSNRELRSRGLAFCLPLLGVGLLLALHNLARFHDPLEFGYRYLTVVWRARIERYGLFSFHYLPRNLGVLLTSLPWWHQPRAPWVINLHGLALWFTTPLYLLLPWSQVHRSEAARGLAWTALCVALPSLFYQNTGWLQFGYRFSNDYAPFLFAWFAVGGLRLRGVALAFAIWGVCVNALGALTFGRPEYSRFYFAERTQTVLYEPD